MRILVLGAGPAGLYFALLAKKAEPAHDITVLERNPPDATYGWGVVFSEETLGSLRDADRATYDQFTERVMTTRSQRVLTSVLTHAPIVGVFVGSSGPLHRSIAYSVAAGVPQTISTRST